MFGGLALVEIHEVVVSDIIAKLRYKGFPHLTRGRPVIQVAGVGVRLLCRGKQELLTEHITVVLDWHNPGLVVKVTDGGHLYTPGGNPEGVVLGYLEFSPV